MNRIYNWLTVLLGNQYLTFRAPIRVYLFNFIILGVLYIVHKYTHVPYPICCVVLGLLLIIRDHKQRWRRDTDNLSGNPTLKKLTTFWYSSMRSRQLNVFYHWLHMWPSGHKLDEVRLWLAFRIYADSLFNPAYEEYKQPKENGYTFILTFPHSKICWQKARICRIGKICQNFTKTAEPAKVCNSSDYAQSA